MLGKWALIDIETSGVDPNYDQIIDVGFLQFDGTELVRSYSSLVQTDVKLSQFIQKLTGITQKMVTKAPAWREVELELVELEDHCLLAHNAKFEESFLDRYFQDSSGNSLVEYHDSLLFLGLLFPKRSSLSLESFIIDFGIAEKEIHRGYEDSLDLLKVSLATCQYFYELTEARHYIDGLVKKYQLDDLWYFRLWQSGPEAWETIAAQVDFDIKKSVSFFEESLNEEQFRFSGHMEKNFSLDFSGENLKSILSDEQKIKTFFPNYKFRESQQSLVVRTGQSFKNNVHAMIQAPTGTGKTLGYMLPSALFSKSEDKQVLVATGTKTLQNQAVKKDLPQLRQLLGLNEDELKVKRLIGSNNHLCELLLRRDNEQDLLSDAEDFEHRFALAFYDFIFFRNDIYGDEITRGDISFVMKRVNRKISELESDIAVDFRACTGKRCPYKSGCSYINGIREAKEANIIIGNHALMFNWPKGFPRPGHIVVDEAHKIEEQASKAFTYELTETVFKHFIKALDNMQGVGALFYLMSLNDETPKQTTEKINSIRKDVKDHALTLLEHLTNFRELSETYFKQRPKYTPIYWNETPMFKKDELNSEVVAALYNHIESFHFIFKSLYELLEPYAAMFEPGELKDDNGLVAYAKFESFFANLDEIYQCLAHIISENENFASSFRFHEEYGFCLQSVPIDVGRVVHEKLLEPSESVVFTSATLANDNGDMGAKGMEWPLGYLYLDPERRFKQGFYLPAVYNYKDNAKVFICDDTPALYDQKFVPSVLSEIVPLIKKLNGRSLLLFSARVRFEVAREILLEKLDKEIPVFIQGMGNNVVEDFKNSENGVLLGMESFGEGIDIPGKSLQFVFVDKIPDLRREHYIEQRRDFYEKSFGNEFIDYFMSHRTRSLHQKLGRLLRTESDHGGAIVVDSRTKRWKGRTFDQFTQLMQPYQVNKSGIKQACESVYEFISQGD